MEVEDSRRGVRVLSLDGGGVKGLSELMILEYLMKSIDPKSPPKPCDVFDIIGGTSTGGLIAIMLGRLQMTVTEAIDAYLELSEQCFAPKHTFNLVARLTNLSQAKGKCDSKALEASIKKTIAKKLGKAQEDALLLEENYKCRVFVCSIRADRRSLICFRNYPADNEMDLEPKIWEAARATSAATTFFDPITIGKYKQVFVDGGGGHNNPVQVAFDEAKTCFPYRDIECLVSIGAGKGEVKAFGRNLMQVGKTLIAIATDTDNTATTFAQTHQELYFEGKDQRLFRFQVEHGMEKVGMQEHEKIRDIAAATQVYMQGKDERGTKQLQIFKALMAETEPSEPGTQVSSVELEAQKILYIEKYGKSLQVTVHKQLLSRKPDYSSATIKLPTRIFCSQNADVIDLSHTSFIHKSGPVWNTLLSRYNTVNEEDDERWETYSVQTAAWYPGFGGSFAAEFPVAELWRLISSYPPEAVHTDESLKPTKLYIGDLLITVPDSIQGKPLVRVELMDESKVKFFGTGKRPICNENRALAMCGGLGIAPDLHNYRKLYDSDAQGWRVVPVPHAFAFAAISSRVDAVSCIFAEHDEWARKQLVHLMKVCHFLWDHADSIDCNEEGVPVKVLLEDLQEIRETKGNAWLSQVPEWRLVTLKEVLERHLNSSPDFCGEGCFVEIEDAVTLLREADTYTAHDIAPWDEDGMNTVVDNWWGRFGAGRARWIALDMTLKMIRNIIGSVTLPHTFTPLLHSPSGSCFLV